MAGDVVTVGPATRARLLEGVEGLGAEFLEALDWLALVDPNHAALCALAFVDELQSRMVVDN